MRKNKKLYSKILVIFFLVVIGLSFFPNKTIALATYEYRNADGNQTTICGLISKDVCAVALKNKCGNDISTVLFCKENLFGGCSNPVEPVCPPVVGSVQTFDPQTDTTNNNTYTLLAPIPGLGETAPTNVGDYFNKIFLVAIGLCGALAVVMIIIGGVQYMGDESIFGKTEAKSRIMSSILGLLIALGSWALLNTINPDLLGGGGVNIKQVSAEILEAPMLQESTGLPAPGVPLGKTNSCPEGYGNVVIAGQVIMHTCKSISAKITTMIQSAKSVGINLSGSSFRSYQDQINTRIANHCPDIYNSPSSACKPPTAIPGTSMHESGLAIDFKCDGVIIQTSDNKCFLWLKANASKPLLGGLKNFSKEPWHWSTNGK